MPRFLRYFRIAFSATCGIACVLLVVLWVRSYWWQDVCSVSVPSSQRLVVMSMEGKLSFRINDSHINRFFSYKTYSVDVVFANLSRESGMSVEQLKKRPRDYSRSFLVASHCVAVIGSAALAAFPWLRWRFSLRTLLIAMTLIAVVLGAVVWMTRAG
jgi:hypothetical protein